MAFAALNEATAAMLTLTELAQATTGTTGIVVMCGAILAWAVLAYLTFRRRLMPLSRQMRTLCETLSAIGDESDFAARFDEIDSAARAGDLTRHAWTEFRETLIYPEIEDPDPVVYQTQSAAAFFGRDDLLGDRVNLRLYNATPNLLTGAGILGTFIGLVAGIYLAAGGLTDPDNGRKALESLLAGASLAFLTSIAGLFSSLLFSSWEKNLLHRFEQRRQCWVNGLDARLRRVTQEGLSRKTLTEVSRQREILTQFTEQLAFQLSAALENTVPRALDQKVTVPVTNALAELKSAVEDLARSQARTSEETLKELVKKFGDSVTGAAGKEMQEFSTAVTVMSEKLQGQVQAVAEQQAEVRRQSEESVSKLAAVFEKGAEGLQQRVSESVTEILAGLRSSVGEMSQLLNSAVTKMASQLQGTTKSFEGAVGSLTGSVDQIGQILTGAQALMNDLDTLVAGTRQAHLGLQEVSKTLSDSVSKAERMGSGLESAARNLQEGSDKLSQAIGRLEEMQSQITSTWAGYAQRFEKVDLSLGSTFQALEAGLTQYSAAVKKYVEDIDKHTASITGTLAGAVEELNSAVEELGEVFSKTRR